MEGIMGYVMAGAEACGAGARWLVAEVEPEWDAEVPQPGWSAEGTQPEGEAEDQAEAEVLGDASEARSEPEPPLFTGMDLGTARQRLRTAHALTKLPVVSAAMSRGELSYSKARAIGRLEEELQSEKAQEAWVELAVKVSAHELESRVRMARQLHGRTEEELERARLRRRRFSIFPDENGMYELRGKVTADVGQMLMQVIEAAADVLFHADGREWSPNGDGRTVRIEEIKPEQRRADALWLIAERIMEVGFEGEEGTDRPAESGKGEETEAAADAAAACAGSRGRSSEDAGAEAVAIAAASVPAGTEQGIPAEPESDGTAIAEAAVPAETTPSTCRDHTPTRCCPPRRRPGMPKMSADRYKVHLFVDERALSGEDEAQPSYFVDGVRIPPEMARRLSCCEPVTEIRRARNGTLLDVHVTSRMPPRWMQTALLHRDGGCRFPGCGAKRVRFHHIVLWQHGGKTTMSNLICLCPYHHREVHEGGFSVKLFADGRGLFTDRAGMPIPDSAPPPRMVNPLDALLAQNQAQGVRAGPMRAAKYRVHRSGDRDSLWQIEARALDAIAGSEKGDAGGGASGG
jgi:hypothetical protein